jgi:hypothetical protein
MNSPSTLDQVDLDLEGAVQLYLPQSALS